MASTQSAGDGGMDLSQFYGIFFEEAGDNAAQMEAMLLELDIEQASDEDLNAIFRCAHSIKGGAATFGFADVAELTHQMESLLDKLRRHELAPEPQMVDVLLESTDAMRALLAVHQGTASEAPPTADLVARIRALANGEGQRVAVAAAAAATAAHAVAAMATPADTPAHTPEPAAQAIGTAVEGGRALQILVGPIDRDDIPEVIGELFRDIPGLGLLTPLPAQGDRIHRFAVQTASTDDDLFDLFSFHVAREMVTIQPAGVAGDAGTAEAMPSGATPNAAAAQAAPEATPVAEPAPVSAPVPAPAPASASASASPRDFGLFDGAPGHPDDPARAAAAAASAASAAPAKPAPPAARPAARPAAAPSAEAATLRVSVGKVDQLINLVGELVINQAMLSQTSQQLDPTQHQATLAGLANLERNIRDLQESVMSIRMIPMSVVFSRFPRMLRDLAGKLGKQVDLVTHGDATELDKGLIEKITDPLTHLVRNSCDHGIELPADRVAAGKDAQGTIMLSAFQQGGSIVIQVRDDGRGLPRDKILKKAMERGLPAHEGMSDAEVWQLIFEPGFSTAEQVTDVSGRGVGMDVVKKNIAALNGTVDIESEWGRGMTVSIRLPLTLAIMDGMSVRVGRELYILPLASVVESFQPGGAQVNTLAHGPSVVRVREDYMPVVDLQRVFDVPQIDGATDAPGVMVVVEADGARIALRVDELVGQHQVVVKNLESNYRRVPCVSGATILGDGRVALIIEPSGLMRRARH